MISRKKIITAAATTTATSYSGGCKSPTDASPNPTNPFSTGRTSSWSVTSSYTITNSKCNFNY